MKFALNHMATPNLSLSHTVRLAQSIASCGIELRNDLSMPLFDGDTPEAARSIIETTGQRLLALAEVQAFNDVTEKRLDDAAKLIDIAQRCGAEAISLIPRNDGLAMGRAERTANLRTALQEFKPILEDGGLFGYIEPLGFEQCTLRFKAEALDAISATGSEHCYRLIHDTFHHCLSGEANYYADMTAIAHVSGVTQSSLAFTEMRDAHRVLVNDQDRLGNIEQLNALMAAGYDGPISFEPFSPEIHSLSDPATAISESINFIKTSVTSSDA